MYERNLWKIMEAYEHMDEYPQKIHEEIKLYNILWDDEESTNDTSDVIDVEYIQEYEGDHRGRYEEIEKYFDETYGEQPDDYDTELLNAEMIDESTIRRGRNGFIITGPAGLYLTKIDNGRYIFSNVKDDVMVFDSSRDAESAASSFETSKLNVMKL